MCTEVFLLPMSQKGFTLIELMVVIAIIAILSVLVYAPYNHYSNIAKVRFSAQKVEQAIDEAKTSVLGGYSFSGGSITRQNVHIGLVFSGSSNVIDMR
jgi:prepilin-type N-terminal cleavage/methylation domain-containing protein